MPSRPDIFTLILIFIISSCIVLLISTYRLPIAGYLFKDDINAMPTPHNEKKTGYGGEVEVMADKNGHYFIDGVVDRTTINFMIDTGASVTVLSYRDAKRLGLTKETGGERVQVQTGSGKVEMSKVSLAYIEIGQIRVDRLDALIAPDHAMDQSVLGMNFLNRITSYRFEQRKMTLVP